MEALTGVKRSSMRLTLPHWNETFEIESPSPTRTASGTRAAESTFPQTVLANKSFERTVNHRGRTVRAVALCARAGAEVRSRAAVQRNR